jgi:hypothetical protein
MSSFIVLSAKGGIKVSNLDTSLSVVEGIAKAFKRAKGPVAVGSWVWQKMRLSLYGYKEGRAGTENKHELPAPYDSTILFGDACVVATLEKGPVAAAAAAAAISLSGDLWKRFYNSKAGAYDDEDDDEEEDEEDLDEEGEEVDEEVDDEEEEVEDTAVLGEVEEEEEEDEMPVLKSKVAGVAFKKIPKWMHIAELEPDVYLL